MSPSHSFNLHRKINGVCICFRRVEYTASSEEQEGRSETLTEKAVTDEVSKLAHDVKVLDVGDRRGSKSSEEYYSPTPPPGSSPYSTSPIQNQPSSHVTSDSANFDRPQPVNEVATVKITEVMTSAPPPTDDLHHPPASGQPYPLSPASNPPPPAASSRPYPPPPAATSQPYPPPPAASSQPYPPPPAASGRPYPPPPAGTSQPYQTGMQPFFLSAVSASHDNMYCPLFPAVGGFPSYKLTPADPSPSYHLSYVSQPPASSYPPPSQPGYDTRIGFAVGGGAYPPPQPPLGYGATAGSSFSGSAVSLLCSEVKLMVNALEWLKGFLLNGCMVLHNI